MFSTSFESKITILIDHTLYVLEPKCNDCVSTTFEYSYGRFTHDCRESY